MHRLQRFLAGLLAGILLLTVVWGCTAYNVARDERPVGAMLDDKALETQIKLDLLKDDTVKGLDIAVYVYFKNIFLVGVVESSAQQHQAVAIADSYQGVRSVTPYLLNKNEVTVGQTIDDTAITTKVKSKLIGDKNIASTQIQVKTIMGHVVLLGVVGSQDEAAKAVRHARSVDNVAQVKSFLMVK